MFTNKSQHPVPDHKSNTDDKRRKKSISCNIVGRCEPPSRLLRFAGTLLFMIMFHLLDSLFCPKGTSSLELIREHK